MAIRDYVDRIGDRLDHPELVAPEFQHLVADDRQRVKRILDIPVSGRVLDVGCSDGAITERIRQRWPVFAVGADVCIHDTSDDRVCWDAREPFPYPDSFDAAYACEVFEHLTPADAQKALANILAVLKPGGDLIVTVPNRYPQDLYEVGCRSRWAWPDHRSSYTVDTLSQFLGVVGGEPTFFPVLEWIPLYDHDRLRESIWLIVHGQGKR